MNRGVLLGVAVTACGAFGADESATADGGVPDDAALGGGGIDEQGCPRGRGPAMVRVDPGFCIDRTEVTRADYRAFLAAKAGDTSGQIPACSENDTYEPSETWPAATDRYAASHIDWCDAYEYCRWAGKRLCGRIGGGPMPALQEDAKRADRDQWYAACSRGGDRNYPYGNDFDSSACNTRPAEGSGRLEEVGTHARCEGGYPGLFDMSGNVWEWEDACTRDDAGSSDAVCFTRGGAFYEGAPSSSCGAAVGHTRLGFHFHIGVRCCAD